MKLCKLFLSFFISSFTLSGFAASQAFDNKKAIGRGRSSEVFRTTHEGQPAVKKRVFLQSSHRAKNLSTAISSFCAAGEHPSIVRVLRPLEQAADNENQYEYVCEYAAHGSLATYLASNKIDYSQQLTFALEIAEGVKHLIENYGVQIQIFTNNILVFEDKAGVLHCKVFPTFHHCFPETALRTSTSRVFEMAPELLRNECHGPEDYIASAVYSYGMILRLLVAREVPFSEMRNDTTSLFPFIMKVTATKELQPTIPDTCESFLRDLIGRTWTVPKDRPEFAKIIEELQKAITFAGALVGIQFIDVPLEDV